MRPLKSIYTSLLWLFVLSFVFLAGASDLKATHLAGGYIRIECVGGNQYKVFLYRYKDASGVALPGTNTIHIDPVNANEGNDVTYTATRVSITTVPIPKTNPCHQPPESSLVIEEHRYETGPFTLPPAPSGYNIYTTTDCCRNFAIVNLVNPGGTQQTLFLRSSDRQEFPCNSSPQFLNYPPLEICVNDTLRFDNSAVDPDGGFDKSMLSIVFQPQHGTASINPNNGRLSYVPNAGFVGLDSLTYRACDKGSPTACDMAKIYIRVTYENLPPQATDDYMSTTTDRQVEVDLLANDNDFDMAINPASLKVIENPLYGDIWYLSNGSMRYVPNGSYVGLDSMKYRICDSGDPRYCDTATVYVTVSRSVNPTFAANDFHIFNTPSTNVLILNNDEAFNSSLSNASIKILKAPRHGSASVLVNKIFYLADLKSNGLDSLQYLVCNTETPASCDSAWVYLIRKPADYPPFAVDDTFRITINSSGSFDVLANDLDKVETLNYSGVSISTKAFHGVATVGATGINYTPPNGFFGLDSFTYQICDAVPEDYCDWAKVYVLVENENYKPFAFKDQYLLDFNTGGTFSVLDNDFDKDSDLLTSGTVQIISGPMHGSATVTGRQIDYTPNNGFNGIDQISYSVCDNGSPQKCDTARIEIFVKANNYLPFAASDTMDPYCFFPHSIYPLLNDHVFNENLDFGSVVITVPPLNGTATINPDLSFTYQADSGYVGPDQFSYRICDDNGDCDETTIYVNATIINLPPNAVDDRKKIGQNTFAIIDLLKNDVDPENNISFESFDIVVPAKHGQVFVSQKGEILYQHDPGFAGLDSFSYRICDNGVPSRCDEAWVRITVISNDPPQVNNDAVTISAFGPTPIRVLKNDNIASGKLDEQTLRLVTPPGYGLAIIDFRNRFVYYPTDSSPTGTDQFTYSICNDGTPKKCGSATVTINLNYNVPPQINNDAISVDYGRPYFFQPLKNDLDPDGRIKRATLEIVSAPLHGDITVLVDSGMIYKPDNTYSGPDQFTYRVCDDGMSIYCRTATVQINVSSNAAPVAANDQFNIQLNTPRKINLAANDSDPDGNLDPAAVRITVNPVHGYIYNLVDGQVIYHPDNNYFGRDSFDYQIADAANPVMKSTARVYLWVAKDPNVTLAVDDYFTIFKNDFGEYDIKQNDGAVDPSSYRIVNYTKNGDAFIENNGLLYYMADQNFFGYDTLKYLVCESPARWNCDTAYAYFEIRDTSYPITAHDDAVDVYEGYFRRIYVLENDFDRDRETAGYTLSVITPPSQGTALAEQGAINYNATPGYTGPDQFVYEVCDNLGCDTATVYIQIVQSVNITPTALNDYWHTHSGKSLVAKPLSNDYDPDQDSLVYTFCAALAGGPYTRSWMPPFDSVIYAPGLSSHYPASSNPRLKIDRKTGLLTGVPNTPGAHVLTTCTEEYKNGRFLGNIRREIQVNIVNCTKQPVATIEDNDGTPNGLILNCVDNTIHFLNTGQADSFLWDFGIPGVASDTSSEYSPTFTYPDTGTYLVTLYAEPGAACMDMDQMIVKIYKTPIPNFSYSEPLCSGQTIRFKDSTNPVNGKIIAWNWKFTPTDFKQQKNPKYKYNSEGVKTITLDVFANTGCKAQIIKDIVINPSPTIDLPKNVFLCKNDTLLLEADDSGASTIIWEPEIDLRHTGSPDKVLLFPSIGRQYSVTAINAFGCKAGDKTVVVPNDRPIIDAGDPLRKCTSPSVSMSPTFKNVSFQPTFQWSPPTGLQDPTSPYTTASPNQTTTYTLTISSEGKYCVESDTVIVYTELPELRLLAEKDVICANDFTQLVAETNTRQATFSWAPASSLSDPNSQYPYATPSVNTTYTLTLYDSITQCTVWDTIRILVKPVAGLSAGPDTTICTGDTVMLQAVNGSRFIWMQDSTLSCQCCESPLAWPRVTNTYTLTGRDTNGCKVSDEVTVFVNQLPTVSAGNDQELCPGDSVIVNLSGASQYIWLDDTSKSCSSCSSIVIYPTVSKDYVVIGIDNNECVDSDTVNIHVYPPPHTAYTDPPHLCEGDTTQLVFSGGAIYNWSPASSLSNPNIADPLAFPDLTTVYTITGVDTNGCPFEDTLKLVVNVLQPGNFIADTGICAGESITLFAKGFSQYTWSPDSNLSCANCPTPVATPLSTTQYMAIVADSNGCVDTGSVLITVNPLPVAVISVTKDTLCFGESTQLSASGGTNYKWTPALGLSDPDIANPVASPPYTINYSLTVLDQNACSSDTTLLIVVNPLPSTYAGEDTAICWDDTIQLFATGADSFIWQGTRFVTCNDCPDPVIAPDVSTAYIVTGYNQYNCTLTDTVQVIVNPEPDAIQLSPDTIICAGDSARLRVSGGAYYQWVTNPDLSCLSCDNPVASPAVSTVYTVQGFTDKGCYRFYNVRVDVRPLPVVTITPDTGVCLALSLGLEASGGLNYLWWPDMEISNANIPNPVITPTQSRYYHVEVSDELGCFTRDSVYVEVYIPMDPNARPDTIICEYQDLVLHAENGVSYNWSPAGPLDDPTIADPSLIPSQTQTFVVEIVDSNGCYNSDTILVEVKPSPVIGASDDIYIYFGSKTTLTVEGAARYEWSPRIAIVDSGNNFITVQPEDTVLYYVTGFNEFNCFTIDSVLVIPVPYLELYIPNAFTPNGDGKNDWFSIGANDLFELLHLKVFDRWGNLVFSTNDPMQGWDGSMGGRPMPMGTYIYILEVRDQVGNLSQRQGNFILIR